MRQYPRLKISSFTSLRDALQEVGENHIIGTWLPLVEVVISPDRMVVQLTAHITIDELHENGKAILLEAEKVLDEIGVAYGRENLSVESFIPGKPVLGAVGLKPINGADAVLTYIEHPERKPFIRKDGTANYYEMNFSYPIQEGDGEGEKIPPQDGVNGMDVFGKTIIAERGNDAPLKFDVKSVVQQEEEGKMVLRALHNGALEFHGDIVAVGKHLLIEGDVGPETGTIKFDGSVTIYGTVHHGYSVVATGDISIEGNEGIRNANLSSQQQVIYT